MIKVTYGYTIHKEKTIELPKEFEYLFEGDNYFYAEEEELKKYHDWLEKEHLENSEEWDCYGISVE